MNKDTSKAIVEAIKADASIDAARLVEGEIKSKILESIVARRKIVAQSLFNNSSK